MQNFNPETFIARAEAFIKKMEGFDAVKTVTQIEEVIARVEAVEQRMFDIAEKIEPLIAVFGIFLPSPVGTALEELPALQDQVLKVKAFVNDTLPLVNNLVGAAGVGAAAASGATIDAKELQPNTETQETAALNSAEAVKAEAAAVGTHI